MHTFGSLICSQALKGTYVPFSLKVKVQYQEPALIGCLIFKLKERPVGGLSFGGDEVIARNRAVKSAV